MKSKRTCQISILNVDPLIFINENMRAEINEIELRKLIEKINKTKNWIFKKIIKISESLARLTRKEKQKEDTYY